MVGLHPYEAQFSLINAYVYEFGLRTRGLLGPELESLAIMSL